MIGVLGGLVGLILGSLRMPALLRWVGEAPQQAVGTNVTVGVFVGVAGALAHLPNAAPDLDVILVGGAASIPGALLGSRLTGRLSDAELCSAIGGRAAGGRGGLHRPGRNLTRWTCRRRPPTSSAT